MPARDPSALKRLQNELGQQDHLARLLQDIEVYQEELSTQSAQLLEAQHRLEASRDHYADLYDFAPFAYLEVDLSGIIQRLNLTATRLLGVERSRAEGWPLLGFVAEGDRPLFLDHLRRLRRGEDPVITELALKSHNGDLPAQLFTRVQEYSTGPTRFRTAVTDLREIKEAEKRLRMSEQRLAAALEASRSGVFEHSIPVRNGYFCSGRWLEMLRLRPEELPAPEDFARWFDRRIHPDDRRRADRAYAKVLNGKRSGYRIEVRVQRSDGVWIWQRILAKVVDWDESGRASRLVGVTLDITDEKRHTVEIERRVFQLRSLASQLLHVEERERHQLACDLHDDLGQLLAAAKLKVYLLKQSLRLPQADKQFEDLTQILDQADQSMRAVMFRASPPVLHDLGLGPALDWLAREIERQYGLRVAVEVDPDLQPLTSEVRTMIFRSVREVLINVVRHAQTGSARVALAASRGSRRLRVLIEDEGVGFDTKGLRWGGKKSVIGFGLVSVRERIEAIGGSITIESAPGQGTRVEMTVPIPLHVVRPQAAPEAEIHELPPAPDRPGATAPRIRVLLADDHGVARSAIASMLSCEPDIEVVAEAADGEAALELARQYSVDVVVMDVCMPRLNGIEATRRILKEFPYVQVIGLSMHEGEDMAAVMRQAGASAYVTKSGPVEALVSTIRAVYANVGNRQG
jgi:PAS domain S-box-containing protein